MMAHHNMTAMLNYYHDTIFPRAFDINRIDDPYAFTSPDLATEEAAAASVIAAILPMILMISLISGIAGLASESIAGEKERGTVATLLVTPLKRSHLALGKIFSLTALSFLSGIGTTVALILSLPNLVGGDLRMDIYGLTDYVLLAVVVLSVMIFLTTVASLISAFAKSLKEAATYVAPLTIIVMVVSVAGMFFGVDNAPAHFLIPIYSSTQSISGIFALQYEPMHIAIAVASNLVYACIGGFVLTKMFNSEKVMFSK